MHCLAKRHSKFMRLVQIGQSSEGRPIYLAQIHPSTGKSDRIIFVDAGMHAREWISHAVALNLIHRLLHHNSNHTISWHVLPVVNPDGYVYSHEVDRLWRKTRSRGSSARCYGVDVNRNFGFHWGGTGARKFSCDPTYGGESPFSEPETRAYRDHVLRHKPSLKAVISLHCYGQLLLYPWGFTSRHHPKHEPLHQIGEKMARAMARSRGTLYTSGQVHSTLYPASGGALDWVSASTEAPFTYTIELPDTGTMGFITMPSQIEPIAQEVWDGLRTLRQEVYQLYREKKI
ncbi:carboxypeptidase B1-like [Oratosquilla oratoria]|uniref:carboxypeptidase B1-like n=1 Tax=Oratosquilla oratoria TaxID=337810 RepID=UPI003F75A73F